MAGIPPPDWTVAYSGALQLNLQSGLLTPFQGLGFALSVLSSRGFLEPKMLKRLRA